MRLLLVIVGIALLWGGGQGAYTALANSEASVSTCAEFDAAEPDADWVQLDECVPDWEQMAYASFAGSDRPTELFIPLRAPGAAPEDPTHIVLATEDEALLDLARTLLSTPDNASDETFDALADRMIAASAAQSYHGTIQFGIELDDDERDQLAGLGGNLHTDFVLLEHDAEPTLWSSVAMFIGGLLALGLGLLLFVRRASASDA